jgi:hypothetical protein
MNDQLEQAILSVLSGSNVSAANDYILKFVETDQSWAAAMTICKTRGDNDNLRYFAANILYTKVGKDMFYTYDRVHKVRVGLILIAFPTRRFVGTGHNWLRIRGSTFIYFFQKLSCQLIFQQLLDRITHGRCLNCTSSCIIRIDSVTPPAHHNNYP